MRFSERLYAIPQGQTQQWASVWNRNGRMSATSTVPRVNVINDLQGRYVLLTHACIIGVPGAGQNVTQMQIELLGPDGGQPTPPWLVNISATALAANVTGVLTFDGELIIPPAWILSSLATFNAGVAANRTDVSYFGYTLPIGTLQAF